ncbi:MAG: GNAT family N-acetyltransferase [Haloarculaceae archaeon]
MTADIAVEVHTNVETVPASQWNDLVEQSPVGSVFHRTGWLRAVERGTDRQSRHVVAFRDGSLVGLLPGFVGTLDTGVRVPTAFERFTPRELVSSQPGFGGPLAVTDEPAVTHRLIDGVRAALDSDIWAHRIRAIDPGHVRAATVLDERGYTLSALTGQMVVDVDCPLEEVVARFSASRRREIQQARKNGLTVTEVDPDRQPIDAFYEYYTELMDRLDAPRFPAAFVRGLADHCGDRLQLLRVDSEGEAVGWHLNVLDEERDELHPYLAGYSADVDYHPAGVMHEHAIEYASSEGYERYNIGESVADPADGGFVHKRQYGSRLVPVLTWERGIAPSRFAAYRIARRCYRAVQARR